VHSSRVIHGENLLPQIDFNIEQVPLFSAWRILHNRLFNLLVLFDVDMLDEDRQIPHQERVAFALAICRLWLDFGMALSLCLGVYAPDYKTRLANLQAESERIAVWFRDWEGLLEGIKVAMEFKKNPRPDRLDLKAVRRGYFLALDSWDRVARVVQAQMLPYYFGRDYELNNIDYWSEAAETCMKVLPRQYYKAYLRVMLRKTDREPSEWYLNQLARLANVHENYTFMGLPFVLTHPRQACISPEIAYFACVPMLAFSITRYKKVHFGLLSKALRLLEPYRSAGFPLTGIDSWQKTRDFCAAFFQDYRAKRGKGRHLPKCLKRK
jgi:hypothetical protein